MKALAISRITAVGFILLLGILHIINTDVDITWQPISFYALANLGWLMNFAFLLLGISFFALGFYLASKIKMLSSKIAGWLLIAASLGNFLASIFNTDPINTLPEKMSTSGSIHSAAAGLLGLMIIATLFVAFAFLKHPKLKPFKTWVLVLTLIVFIIEVVTVIAMATYLSETNGMLTPDTPVGILGRLIILACAAWVIVTSSSLMKVSKAKNMSVTQKNNFTL